MLRLESEQRMLQKGDGPKLGDTFERLTTLLVYRSQLLLRTTLCKRFMINSTTTCSCDCRATRRHIPTKNKLDTLNFFLILGKDALLRIPNVNFGE